MLIMMMKSMVILGEYYVILIANRPSGSQGRKQRANARKKRRVDDSDEEMVGYAQLTDYYLKLR
jgi:hypothetical protein